MATAKSQYVATVPDRRYRKALRNKLSLQAILHEADIELDGSRPWDIEVHDDRFYDRVFRDGDMGVGESYVAGWWDCARLDELTERVLEHDLYRHAGGAGEAGSCKYGLGCATSKAAGTARGRRLRLPGHRHHDIRSARILCQRRLPGSAGSHIVLGLPRCPPGKLWAL